MKKKKLSKAAKAQSKKAKPAVQVPPDLREIVESLNDVIYARDSQGRCTYISAAAERVFGYKPSELIGNTFVHLIHPDDREYVAGVARALDRGEFAESEHRLV